MKEIKLTQGVVALVDDSDFEELNKYRWRTDKRKNNTYARRSVWDKEKKTNGVEYMHNRILQTPVGMHSDHMNHNGLDNRRSNLRVCTAQENNRNRLKQDKNTSGYKGVSWDKDYSKWRAQIKAKSKVVNLGRFACKKEAARVYDRAAVESFGEFAVVNFKN